jgi:hypothetical protein
VKLKRTTSSSRRFAILPRLIGGCALCVAIIQAPRVCAQASGPNSAGQRWDCIQSLNLAKDASGNVLWLDSTTLKKRIISKTNLKEPCCARSNLHGDVEVELALDASGEVACVRAVSGHPIGIASVVAAVPKWRFRAFRRCGKPRPVLGRMTVAYDFRGGANAAPPTATKR